MMAQSCVAIDGKDKFNMPDSPTPQDLTTVPVMRSHRTSSSHLLGESALPTPSRVYSYLSEHDTKRKKHHKDHATNIYGNFTTNSSARGSLNSSQKHLTIIHKPSRKHTKHKHKHNPAALCMSGKENANNNTSNNGNHTRTKHNKSMHVRTKSNKSKHKHKHRSPKHKSP